MATGRVPTTANSPLTAKGDLFSYSTAPARLAVGNDGEQIVADSSTSTGLRYTAGNPIGNPVLNSAYQIWQRGTSITGTGSTIYTADRWSTNASSSFTVTRQATGDTTNLPNIQYCARFQRTAAQTTTTAFSFVQSFETVNSIPFAGKTVTMSFYARKGANYSQASSILPSYLISGTGTDQNYQTGYTGTVLTLSNSSTLTTTWQRFTFTGTVAATATELTTYFEYTGVGTAGAADYFEITGVQLDIGSVALPFRTYAGTIQGELAACQRYYYRMVGTPSGNAFSAGFNDSTTKAVLKEPFKVSMRIPPTALEQSGTATDYAVRHAASAITTCSAVPNFVTATADESTVEFNVASGLTAGQGCVGRAATTSAYLGWSAEL